MFNRKQRRAGKAAANTDARADAVLQSAIVLGRTLGIPDAALARSALTAVVTLAADDGDPDGLMRELIAAAMEGKADG